MSHHPMSFNWSTDVGLFMFPGLNINGVGQLVGLCAVLFIFALVFEAFKILQTRNKSRAAREVLHERSCPAASLLNNEESNQTEVQIRKRREFLNRVSNTCQQTLVFLFQTILGYLLMLAVMVYNGYVFLIVVLGFAIGYFFFGHIAMKINMENVRARKTYVICSPSCPNEPSTSISNECENTTKANSKYGGCQHTKTPKQINNYEQEGYTNELAMSSSSSSLSTSLTQTTHLEKEIDVHNIGDCYDNDSNLVHSCRL